MTMGEKLLNDFEKSMSKSEEILVSVLKSLPHPDHDDDQFYGLIFGIVVSGRENGWVNEFIRICEGNPDLDFDGITKLIFTDERFPPLEIVDDDEE